METEHPPLANPSLRDQIVFSIGFALSQNRDLLRRMVREHVSDEAREQLGKRVVEHLELSGFEIDEGERVMRKHDRGRGW